MANKISTFCDEIIGDGVTYRYIVTHLFNSIKILSQLIDSKSGINISEDKYTLIRKNPNNIVIEFNNPPLKNDLYYVLLIKVE